MSFTNTSEPITSWGFIDKSNNPSMITHNSTANVFNSIANGNLDSSSTVFLNFNNFTFSNGVFTYTGNPTINAIIKITINNVTRSNTSSTIPNAFSFRFLKNGLLDYTYVLNARYTNTTINSCNFTITHYITSISTNDTIECDLAINRTDTYTFFNYQATIFEVL